MKRYLIVVFMTLMALEAKEVFTVEEILPLLDKKNPFVYETLAKESIYKQKVNYFLGDFDTKLSADYEKKDYPLSQADFFDFTIEKPLENGVEFLLGYRDVQGTQEYNNIETGEEGESRFGVKIPIISLLHNMSERKFNLYSAKLESQKFHFISQDNFRQLYFEIVSSYHRLLYTKALLDLAKGLLTTAEKREHIIKQRVRHGSLAEITLLEADQQVINRSQRLVLAENEFQNALVTFLNYINTSKEAFDSSYTLPNMSEHQRASVDLQAAMDIALKNRPDLEILQYNIKKLKLREENTQLLKYPNVNLSLYGIHDEVYENGFKMRLSMDFPVRRRKYEGAQAANKYRLRDIENDKKKRVLIIEANLNKIINSLRSLNININASEKEVFLVEKLEAAEQKKYKVGLSNLFIVNQREVYTMETKKKLLAYKLQRLLLQEKLNRELGIKY